MTQINKKISENYNTNQIENKYLILKTDNNLLSDENESENLNRMSKLKIPSEIHTKTASRRLPVFRSKNLSAKMENSHHNKTPSQNLMFGRQKEGEINSLKNTRMLKKPVFRLY